MIRLILCASLLSLALCASGDLFCVEKQQLGDAPGTLYSIEATCERCACDGQASKFCSKDYACQDKKDASNRRPCFFAANKIPHGSQIQVDCNICQCKNTTMVCTQDVCPGMESSKKVETKVEQPLLGSTNTGAGECEDYNKNCRYWSDQGLCDTNNVVKKKCVKSCGDCTAPKAQCVDTDDRCVAWYQRGKQELCNKNTFMKKHCRETCNICTGRAPSEVVLAAKPMVCVDQDSKCKAWSNRGLCESSGYMKKKCKKACNLCPKEEDKKEENQTTGSVCEDNSSDCPAWHKGGHCTKSKYVEKNCRLSCGTCTPVHAVVEVKVVNEVAAKVAEETNKQLTFEEEWRQRLIKEGKLKVDTGPQGCTFREGGRLYPWGSSIQGGCGICKCRRREDDSYYFQCDEC